MTDTSTDASTAAETLRFEPPGPGGWMLDTTHHGRRPVTRFLQPLMKEAFEEGMPQLFRRYGLPLASTHTEYVHGCSYLRLRGIGEPDDPKGDPPAIVLKLVSRVHPELRRRNRTAAQALRERRWRADVDQWFNHDRAEVVAANRNLQHVDLHALDDEALVGHVDECLAHARRCAIDGFANHGGDIVPTGLYVAACAGWGIDATEAAALLRGASPATLQNDRLLAPVARAIAAAATPPATIGDVRALGPDVAAVIDEWMEDQGWRLTTSDDLDAPTLAERPDAALRALLAARPDPVEPGVPDTSALRDRVPQAERARFDDVLAEARYGLRMRDDHVGVRWNWPVGILRRALLEVGRRLVERDRAEESGHAVELEPGEVAAALAGDGPTAGELAARRRTRDEVEVIGAPLHLGPEPEGPPPFDLFPTPLATMAKGVFAMINAMEGDRTGEPLTGIGIGDATVRGRACVVRSALDAVDALESGDVLVTPFTSPSYDSLFPLVAAVVTDEGGPLSHAAIMAREFGVAAVIGATDATATIPHGAMVEVDPGTGSVRVVETG